MAFPEVEKTEIQIVERFGMWVLRLEPICLNFTWRLFRRSGRSGRIGHRGRCGHACQEKESTEADDSVARHEKWLGV